MPQESGSVENAVADQIMVSNVVDAGPLGIGKRKYTNEME